MTPLVFGGRFGWLHDAAPGARMGVVLCSAWGQEEICTRHGLMHLGEQLAAAGLPTLRFDYAGTGHSADGDVTIDGMEADVRHAADRLRRETGVATVALCGLRLGAALALRAAPEIADLAALVLLAPPVSGRQLLRQVRVAASMSSLSHHDPVPPADSGLPLNTNGFLWSGSLQRQVAALDFAGMPTPAVPLLIAAERSNRAAGGWAEALRGRGARVVEQDFVDYDTYMCDPTTHLVPGQTFAAVTAWLAAQVPAVASRPPHPSHDPVLTLPGVTERPIIIGNGLFGILSEPSWRAAAPVAALLLHEGSSHSIGNGRAYVALARRLAQRGIASLRLDLSGIGDSPAGDNDRNPHYDPERGAEVTAAIDWLDRRGHARVATFGLCSGAYTAYQAALADERVVGFVAVNLQKFVWTYGDDIRVAVRAMKRTLPSYLRSMRNPAEWRRLLTGQADLIGVAAVLARRAWKTVVHRAASLLPATRGSTTATVHDQVRGLAVRGVRAHFLFSKHDPGIAEMRLRFGPAARRLRGFSGTRMTVMNGADHHLNGREARARYFAYVEHALADMIADCAVPGGIIREVAAVQCDPGASGHGRAPSSPVPAYRRRSQHQR